MAQDFGEEKQFLCITSRLSGKHVCVVNFNLWTNPDICMGCPGKRHGHGQMNKCQKETPLSNLEQLLDQN